MCRSDNKTALTFALDKARQIAEKAGNGIGRFHRFPRCFDDDYRLTQSILGSGAFATVCMAVNRHTGGQVAVKRLRLKDLSAIEHCRILMEASILYAMDHPNVVRLVDVYQSDEDLDIVMECMGGGELFNRLTECGKFAEADAAHTMRQIMLAVHYVHGKNLAHRDLKLENVLYETSGGNHLKVADFGLAKIMEIGMRMSPKVGTPGYRAPEVQRNDYSMQCDSWSLGVVAHALLTGKMPLAPLGTEQGFNIVQEEWIGVSPLCLDFVKGLLMQDPSRRLTTQRALEHPWFVEYQRSVALPHVSKQVVSGLRAFAKASPLRRACMSAMAWSLGNEEQAKVRDAFAAFDQNNSGVIEFRELQKVLSGTFGIGKAEISSILRVLDTTGDQTITYSEFLAAMCGSRISVKECHVRDVFRRFDCDGSGSITATDMEEVLQQPPQAGITATALLEEADWSGNGAVTVGELGAFLRRSRLMLCLSALTPGPKAKRMM